MQHPRGRKESFVGGFDLSTGAIFAVSSVTSAWIAINFNPYIGLLIAPIIGIILGYLNGIIITEELTTSIANEQIKQRSSII